MLKKSISPNNIYLTSHITLLIIGFVQKLKKGQLVSPRAARSASESKEETQQIQKSKL